MAKLVGRDVRVFIRDYSPTGGVVAETYGRTIDSSSDGSLGELIDAECEIIEQAADQLTKGVWSFIYSKNDVVVRVRESFSDGVIKERELIAVSYDADSLFGDKEAE